MKTVVKSHETLIRNVCEELNVQDTDVVNGLIKKLLDTSYTSVKAKKDPNRVKKAKSSYLFYCEDKRKEIQKENPGKSMGDISKILGSNWRKLTDEEKVKYNEQHDEDVERYENDK